MSSKNIKPVDCNRECGQRVYFDRTSENGWSATGKMVPLQWDDEKGATDVGHQCPNSDYNKRRQGGQTTTTTREPRVPSTVEMQLGNQLDTLAKVEQILRQQEQQSQMIYRLDQKVTKLIEREFGNPLDDDGDSLRESNGRDSE